MKVTAYGLALSPCPGMGIPELWTLLETYSSKQLQVLGNFLKGTTAADNPLIAKGLFLAIGDYGTDYKAGVMLKVRDAKSFFTVHETNSKLTISAHQLSDEKSKLSEINFFLFRKDTGKGVYAYYHQSGHMNDFCKLVAGIHNAQLNTIRADLDGMKAASKITSGEHKKRLKELTKFKYVMMSRDGDVADLVDALKRIRKMRIVFEDWKVNAGGDLSPLIAQSKNAAISMSFDDKTANQGSLKTLIRSLLSGSQKKLSKLRVEGTDPDDMEEIINLTKNLKHFAIDELDALAKTFTDIDLADLAESWKTSQALNWLKKAMEKDPDTIKQFS